MGINRKQINAKIQKLKIEIAKLIDKERAICAKTIWICKHCKKKTHIKKITVFKVYSYNCEDWEFNDRYVFLCPECLYIKHYSGEELYAMLGPLSEDAAFRKVIHVEQDGYPDRLKPLGTHQLFDIRGVIYK